MTEPSPTLAEWRRLYQLAGEVKELSPWVWMDETNVFGLQNPETGETGFVSVMGALGEHYGISLYLGARGLYGFWRMQDQGDLTANPQIFFEVPQLQASWEDREELEKQDRDLIKELGLKFRGRQSWPHFRSYRPGYFPWHLEAAEARFLALALEQLLDVAPRIQADEDLLDPYDDDRYLVRVARREGANLTWEDQIIEIPEPEDPVVDVPMDAGALEHLQSLPLEDLVLEVDLFWLPAPIGERGQRPYYPYVLLVVDSREGFILGQELLPPFPSLEAMWGQAPLKLVELLARVGVRPKEIKVRSERLQVLFDLLVADLGFKLRHVSKLRQLEPVIRTLISSLERY